MTAHSSRTGSRQSRLLNNGTRCPRSPVTIGWPSSSKKTILRGNNKVSDMFIDASSAEPMPGRRSWRSVLLVLTTWLCTALVVPATSTAAVAANDGCPPSGHFYGVAHQGAHDTENGVTTYRNTAAAFKRAELRCQWVESDVRFTSDGIAVMVHDQSTFPMFRGRCDLIVSEHTLAEIRTECRNPDGSSVATFDQYLRIVDVRGFAEVKAGNVSVRKLRKLITAIYAAGDADVVSLETTKPVVLDRIAALDNDRNPISRAWKGAQVADPDEVARICEYALYWHSKVTRESVGRLEARGVQSISLRTADAATWDRLASTGASGTLIDESQAMFAWQNTR